MRSRIALCVVLAVIIIVIPLLALGGGNVPKTVDPGLTGQTDLSSGKYSDFKVLLASSGQVVAMSEEDYIRGVVAAEMPASFNIEALKAQAAVAYTYAYLKRSQERISHSAGLSGADISDSPDKQQGYISDSKAREKWGAKADEYLGKIKEAAEAVRGKIIVYKGQPILAAYHAISSGMTESSKIVWGNDIPYLQSVISPGDQLAPEYMTTVKRTPDEFRSAAGNLGVNNLEGDPGQWITDVKISEAKTVLTLKVCGKELKGSQIRSAFGLRAASFEVEYKDGSFVFVVYGYGHGAGMSQYGADYMARQGSSWEEIIRHYYTDVEIANV